MDSIKIDKVVDNSEPIIYEPKESQSYNIIVDKKIVDEKRKITLNDFNRMIENAERIHKESLDEDLVGFRELMLEKYEIYEPKPVVEPEHDDVLKEHFDFINELLNL